MASGQWWVVNHPTNTGGRLPVLQTHYEIVQSDTNPGAVVGGPFATKGEAEAWLNKANAYGNNPASAAGQAAKDATQAVANAVPGLSQIGTFFNDLSQASTWIRVGEVLLGFILVAVGLARITHAVPVATKVAKAVGAVGLL